MMFRIAEQVANQNNCKALLTGESVGQVASQTVVNLNTINNAIDMLVLRPLIGTDKKDAIELAGKIGTLELSNQQVPDSCTVFAPSSPSTAVPVWRIEKDEEKIPDYPQILEKIISEIEVCNYE
jgi:thiamine biosynthesis protein ThiI